MASVRTKSPAASTTKKASRPTKGRSAAPERKASSKPAAKRTKPSTSGQGPRPADLSPTEGDDAIKRKAGVAKLEAMMRREQPGSWARPGGFCLLAAPAKHSAREVIESLAAFVSAFLDFSKLPQEMMTWTVTFRGWHLVFYFSIPRPHVWMEGEHMSDELQDLDRYLFMDFWGPESESLVEWDGTKLDVYHPGSVPPNRSLPKRYGVTAKRPVPALFQAITGISLAELEAAIPHGEPWWIVHNRSMLFPIQWAPDDGS